MVSPTAPDVDGGGASQNGRDGRGRFAKGNRISRGNPLARRVARLRAALVRATTPEDIEAVVKALIEKARSGDVAAAKELLDRTLGKSEAIDLDHDRALKPSDVRDLIRTVIEVAKRRFGTEGASELYRGIDAELKQGSL